MLVDHSRALFACWTGALDGTTTGSSWSGGRWRVDAGGRQLELSACYAGDVRRQTVRRVRHFRRPGSDFRTISAMHSLLSTGRTYGPGTVTPSCVTSGSCLLLPRFCAMVTLMRLRSVS